MGFSIQCNRAAFDAATGRDAKDVLAFLENREYV